MKKSKDFHLHHPGITRRRFVQANLLLAAGLLANARADASGEDRETEGGEIVVYKSPSCGCCQAWVDYLEDHDFDVIVHNRRSMDEVKAMLGLTDPRLHSCHTAVIDGYIVEGHVPVADIRRMIREKPSILGITAPGMPQMSPGMGSIEPSGYDVYSFDGAGDIRLFSRY